MSDLVMWQDFLGACLLLNYAVICVWFALFCLAHDRLYRLHTRWFQLSTNQFDAIHYLGIALYKIAVLMFNLVPWLALHFLY